MSSSWAEAFFRHINGLERPVMYLVNAFIDPDPQGAGGPRFSGNPAAVSCIRVMIICFSVNVRLSSHHEALEGKIKLLRL